MARQARNKKSPQSHQVEINRTSDEKQRGPETSEENPGGKASEERDQEQPEVHVRCKKREAEEQEVLQKKSRRADETGTKRKTDQDTGELEDPITEGRERTKREIELPSGSRDQAVYRGAEDNLLRKCRTL